MISLTFFSLNGLGCYLMVKGSFHINPYITANEELK